MVAVIFAVLFVPCLVVAVMLSLVFFANFWHQPTCIACGGTGRHRKGCPDGDDE